MKAEKWTDEQVLQAYADTSSAREEAQRYLFCFSDFRKETELHVLGNLGTTEDAQDLYTDAFIELDKQLDRKQYRGEGTLKAYFMGIVRNKWLKTLEKRRKQPLLANSDLLLNTHLADEDQGTHEDIVQEEYRNTLHNIVLDIAGERCMKMLLFDRQGATGKEMAERFGFNSEQTFKNQLLRCQNKIKAYLSKHPNLKGFFFNFDD